MFKNPQGSVRNNNTIIFSEFLSEVENGRVVQVEIQGKNIKGVLSNGKSFSALEMLNFAFKYFNLDYRNFVNIEKKYFRKNDINIKISDYKNCLKRNKLKRKSIIYGKKIIYELINFYQRNKI